MEWQALLLHLELGGNHAKIAEEMGANIRDVTYILSQSHVQTALAVTGAALGSHFVDVVNGLSAKYFSALIGLIDSTKDRSRIEGLRMLTGLYEKIYSGKMRTPDAHVESGDVDNMDRSRLASSLAAAARTLH